VLHLLSRTTGGMDADEQPRKLPQESIRTSTILRLASISIRFAAA
jgi:hypothetical protein